jgi:hypothetical protein
LKTRLKGATAQLDRVKSSLDAKAAKSPVVGAQDPSLTIY